MTPPPPSAAAAASRAVFKHAKTSGSLWASPFLASPAVLRLRVRSPVAGLEGRVGFTGARQSLSVGEPLRLLLLAGGGHFL
ncbi:UNVERIFIED_CONTAM: hypothetical protein K2H54_056020 [Gekko kuhli]